MPGKEKEREKIYYDNTFNKTNLNLFTQAQTNVLMAILSKMGQSMDEDGRFFAEYNFKEIRRMTEMKELYASKLEKALSKLIETKVKFFENGQYYSGRLFSKCILTSKSTVKITLSTEMTQKLILNKSEYTILELDEYVQIRNKYAKELYRLLRQFRHTGILIIKKEDLLEIISPPKSYNDYDIIRETLNPAIKGNQKHFENLKLTNYTKGGNGLPEICKFTFKKHAKKNIKKVFEGESEEDAELLKYIMENGGI